MACGERVVALLSLHLVQCGPVGWDSWRATWQVHIWLRGGPVQQALEAQVPRVGHQLDEHAMEDQKLLTFLWNLYGMDKSICHFSWGLCHNIGQRDQLAGRPESTALIHDLDDRMLMESEQEATRDEQRQAGACCTGSVQVGWGLEACQAFPPIASGTSHQKEAQGLRGLCRLQREPFPHPGTWFQLVEQMAKAARLSGASPHRRDDGHQPRPLESRNAALSRPPLRRRPGCGKQVLAVDFGKSCSAGGCVRHCQGLS